MTAIRDIWSILTRAQRRAAIRLFGLMIIAMTLEMLGLGIVVPALALMVTDSPMTPPPALATWLNWLGNPTRPVLLLGGLTALLALYAFKAAFVLFSSWRQSQFIRSVECTVSERLFATYLAQPWTFHLQKNPAELIRNVNEVRQLSFALGTMLSTLAEAFVLVGIVGLLLWFEPAGALAVAALLVAATVVLERLTKSRLRRWGQEAQHHNMYFGKHLMQGLHAAKDIKILGCERSFIDRFTHHSWRRAALHARQALFAQIPRLWFELLAVAALCLLTAVMVGQGQPTKEMVPTLGLFAVAAFRMLPSINKLAAGMQSLRTVEATAHTITSDLRHSPLLSGPPAEPPRFAFRDSIDIAAVSYRYPSASSPSLRTITLTIPHGTSVGLIGGSGAGKTTLVDVVLGLLSPTDGHVLVDGSDIATNLRGWQRLIGYVPQAIYLSDDSIKANVAFGVRTEDIDDHAVSRALRSAQLDEFVNQLPQGAETVIGDRGVRLSGGQRQRIGIARALYHDPELLVLDEATSALDNDTERGVMEAIDALHGAKTLLIVAHRLTTVQRCDLIYRLENGAVVRSGSYADVVTH